METVLLSVETAISRTRAAEGNHSAPLHSGAICCSRKRPDMLPVVSSLTVVISHKSINFDGLLPIICLMPQV